MFGMFRVWGLAMPLMLRTDQCTGGAFDGALLAHAAVRSAARAADGAPAPPLPPTLPPGG